MRRGTNENTARRKAGRVLCKSITSTYISEMCRLLQKSLYRKAKSIRHRYTPILQRVSNELTRWEFDGVICSFEETVTAAQGRA